MLSASKVQQARVLGRKSLWSVPSIRPPVKPRKIHPILSYPARAALSVLTNVPPSSHDLKHSTLRSEDWHQRRFSAQVPQKPIKAAEDDRQPAAKPGATETPPLTPSKADESKEVSKPPENDSGSGGGGGKRKGFKGGSVRFFCITWGAEAALYWCYMGLTIFTLGGTFAKRQDNEINFVLTEKERCTVLQKGSLCKSDSINALFASLLAIDLEREPFKVAYSESWRCYQLRCVFRSQARLQAAWSMSPWVSDIVCGAHWRVMEWYITLPREKVAVVPIMLSNTVVFLAWQIPLLQPMLYKHFVDYGTPGRHYKMVTTRFSHRTPLAFLAAQALVWTFGGLSVEGQRLCVASKSREQDKAGTWGQRPRDIEACSRTSVFYMHCGLSAGFATRVFTAWRFARRCHIWKPILRYNLRTYDKRAQWLSQKLESRAATGWMGAQGAIYGSVTLAACVVPEWKVNIVGIESGPPLRSLVIGALLIDVVGLVRGWKAVNHVAHLGGAAAGWLWFTWLGDWWAGYTGAERLLREEPAQDETGETAAQNEDSERPAQHESGERSAQDETRKASALDETREESAPEERFSDL